MNKIFAYRLKTARKMKGFSMQYLADMIGISKNMISKYENGKSIPDSPKLIALANILNVKPDYFFRPIDVSLETIKFRKKAKFSKNKVESIKAKIVDKMENYLAVENILNIKSGFSNPLAKFSINYINDAEDATQKLREKWQIGNDPIHNIISLLEVNEIKVVEIDEPDTKLFDGLSAFINDTFPVIVINSNFPIERKRFTLLHELGHLLLNFPADISKKEEERICDRFAGAMLLPKKIIFKEIGMMRERISINELMNFQKRFGISIPAQIYRLADLGVISEYKKKQFYISRNKSIDFKRMVDEPRFDGSEFSERFDRLVYKALSQEIITISKAAALLNTDISEINHKLAII